MAITARGWRRIAVAVGGLLGIAFAIPFLVPVSGFIPEITRVASAKLGQPVMLADLSLHLLPTPRIVAEGIRIGKFSEVQIEELEIVPEILSFVSGPRMIRLIRAENALLKEAAIGFLGGMPKSAPGEPLNVRRLVLSGVRLEHASVLLPEFDVDATLAEGFTVDKASLWTRDKALRLAIEPDGTGAARIALTASEWTLPFGAPLKFDSLTAAGTLKRSALDLSAIEGKLYGGTLKGHARATWSQQWHLSGMAVLSGVDLVPVQVALGKPGRLSGRLETKAAFSARAMNPGQLRTGLVLDGPFEVLGGAYEGVDLSKAGDITGRVAAGDSTSFEELKGTLQLRGKRMRIEHLCVRSPKVIAGGHIEVGADEALSGKLDVSVAKTGGFVGVPVTLGGTTSDPSIRPSTGYIVGAAVGTILLPGIGTALGASAGSAFGGKSPCK
jgi:hypothetical protein